MGLVLRINKHTTIGHSSKAISIGLQQIIKELTVTLMIVTVASLCRLLIYVLQEISIFSKIEIYISNFPKFGTRCSHYSVNDFYE